MASLEGSLFHIFNDIITKLFSPSNEIYFHIIAARVEHITKILLKAALTQKFDVDSLIIKSHP